MAHDNTPSEPSIPPRQLDETLNQMNQQRMKSELRKVFMNAALAVAGVVAFSAGTRLIEKAEKIIPLQTVHASTQYRQAMVECVGHTLIDHAAEFAKYSDPDKSSDNLAKYQTQNDVCAVKSARKSMAHGTPTRQAGVLVSLFGLLAAGCGIGFGLLHKERYDTAKWKASINKP